MFGLFVGMIYASVLTGSAIQESISNFNDRFEARQNYKLTYVDFRGVERRVDNNHMVTERTMNGDNCLIDMKTEEILINYTRIKKANEEYQEKQWEEKKRNSFENRKINEIKNNNPKFLFEKKMGLYSRNKRIKDDIRVYRYKTYNNPTLIYLEQNNDYNKFNEKFRLHYGVIIEIPYTEDIKISKKLYDQYIEFVKNNKNNALKYKNGKYFASILPPIASYESFLRQWKENNGYIIEGGK